MAGGSNPLTPTSKFKGLRYFRGPFFCVKISLGTKWGTRSRPLGDKITPSLERNVLCLWFELRGFPLPPSRRCQLATQILKSAIDPVLLFLALRTEFFTLKPEVLPRPRDKGIVHSPFLCEHGHIGPEQKE